MINRDPRSAIRDSQSAIRVPRRLGRCDLPLLLTVFAAQVVLGTALRAVPVRMLARSIARFRAVARRVAIAPEERLVWAIECVGRRLPWISTCLVRALAADLFLGGQASTAYVRIGVRRAQNGSLESHAWFERDGRILVGAQGAAEYTPFLILDCGSRIADRLSLS